MKKNYFLFCVWILLAVIYGSPVFSQTKIIPYQELPTSTGSATGSGMYFGASMNTSSITITFQGPSDRWIAFGFATSMSPADMFTYSNGQVLTPNPLGWEDYYNGTTAATYVLADTIQNWTVISTGTTSSNQRSVTAIRALSTGDITYDVILSYSATSLDLIWARGATADYTLAYHGSTNRANGIKLPWLTPPAASFAVTSSTVCQGAPVTFSNLSTGGLTSYTWAFDSGSPAVSNATNASVTYSLPGTYSVSLIALNILGSDTLRKINYITVTPTVATALSIALSGGSNPICQGSLATFSLISTNGGTTPSYQWKINGVNSGGNSSALTTTLSANAPVTCVMTSNQGCASPSIITSAAITMTVNSNAPASVVISQVGGSNPLCNGDVITYNASPGNGGTSPSYQWQVNGTNVGTNSSTFTLNTLSNGDVVNCILSSSSPCASSTLATSSALTMSVSSFLTPSISIGISSGPNPICGSALITVTASAANEGTNANYQWLINGLNGGLVNTPTVGLFLNSGEALSCILTSGLNCASPSTAISNAINFTVNPVPPTPTISASGPLSFCEGGSVILSSSGQYPPSWSNSATTPTLFVTTNGFFSVLQTLNGCMSFPSPTVQVVVNPLPAVTMQTISAICLSSGTFALVQGGPAGGSYSGPGLTGLIFSPNQSGLGNFLITYSYINNKGCSDSASITLEVDACLGINKNVLDAELSIFPNPTSGNITINSINEEINSVSILDLDGRLISKQSWNHTNTALLDFTDQTSGIYTLMIVLKSRTVYAKISKNE